MGQPTELLTDCLSQMFFTRGKPEGVVNFGVHCRKHPHEGIVAGSLVLLDRIKEVKRWFATHWHCRCAVQNAC